MNSGYIENPRTLGQTPADLQAELIRTIREGQWRTVIIARDSAGNILETVFPENDLKLRHDNDIAACELIPFIEETDKRIDTSKTVFGHLTVKNNQILVVMASNSEAKPVDEKSWKQPVILFLPATTSNPNIGAVFSICGKTQQCIIHMPLVSRTSAVTIFARRYVSLDQLRLDHPGADISSLSISRPVSLNLLI